MTERGAGAADGPCIRLLIADDQTLAREALRNIFEPESGFEIVGECSDAGEVLDHVERTAPDVVVIDIRMRRASGADAIRLLRARDAAPPVLVLTSYDDDETLVGALDAGAAGFALKDSDFSGLHQAVRAVAAGHGWVDPSVAPRVLEAFRLGSTRRSAPGSVSRLTERELDVLRLVASGLSNSEIAGALAVSEGTVKTHVSNVLAKLGRRSRVAAAMYAVETGLVSPGGAA